MCRKDGTLTVIRVLIESPYAGDVKRNTEYAKKCVLDCLKRGEAPYASHLFFTQDGLLDDTNPAQRALGIEAGLSWATMADLVAVYTDLGISDGMRFGIYRHEFNDKQITYRTIND